MDGRPAATVMTLATRTDAQEAGNVTKTAGETTASETVVTV